MTSHTGVKVSPALFRVLSLWVLLGCLGLLLVWVPRVSADDLALDPLQVLPADPEEGDTLTVSTLLYNHGEAVEGVRVLGKFNNLVLYDQTLDIAANGTASVVFQFKLNHTVAIINVLADPYDDQADPDRSNNVVTKVIELEGAQPPYAALTAGLIILVGGGLAYGYMWRQSRQEERRTGHRPHEQLTPKVGPATEDELEPEGECKAEPDAGPEEGSDAEPELEPEEGSDAEPEREPE